MLLFDKNNYQNNNRIKKDEIKKNSNNNLKKVLYNSKIFLRNRIYEDKTHKKNKNLIYIKIELLKIKKILIIKI